MRFKAARCENGRRLSLAIFRFRLHAATKFDNSERKIFLTCGIRQSDACSEESL
jgi:hypothetical protein